jgi:hypothetical protein
MSLTAEDRELIRFCTCTIVKAIGMLNFTIKFPHSMGKEYDMTDYDKLIAGLEGKEKPAVQKNT